MTNPARTGLPVAATTPLPTSRAQPATARAGGWTYALLAVLAAALLGFLGYQLGFLGFVYEIMVPGEFAAYGALTLGVVIGVAAFFSPCAFPLLPAYVSYGLTVRGETNGNFGKSLRLGLAAAAGLLVVVLAIGGLIAVLRASTPFQPDPRQDEPWILGVRVVAGIAIGLFGLLALTGRTGAVGRWFHRIQPGGPRPDAETRSHPARGMFLYGLGYSAAGIGCTGPLLLALMLYAFAFPGPAASLGAFAVFAVTMATLMVFVTVLVGLAKRSALERLKSAAPTMQRVAGAVALLAGAWTVYSVTFGLDLFVRWFFRFLPQ